MRGLNDALVEPALGHLLEATMAAWRPWSISGGAMTLLYFACFLVMKVFFKVKKIFKLLSESQDIRPRRFGYRPERRNVLGASEAPAGARFKFGS